MKAPQRFTDWLSGHEHQDDYGHVYRYHPRSNAHSQSLCRFLLDDLMERSPVLREQAARGVIAYGIDLKHVWPGSGKKKTIDLAIGRPGESMAGPLPLRDMAEVKKMAEVFISCEAKTVMTEHGKSQPRLFDELGSSHEIVHQGNQNALALGVTVVNIAATFVSPLRQRSPQRLQVSEHKQPYIAEKMVNHLRGLPIRDTVGDVGFDAYCTVVLECDNQHDTSLWQDPPAPQPGDRDHYETFLERVTRFYQQRFGDIR